MASTAAVGNIQQQEWLRKRAAKQGKTPLPTETVVGGQGLFASAGGDIESRALGGVKNQLVTSTLKGKQVAQFSVPTAQTTLGDVTQAQFLDRQAQMRAAEQMGAWQQEGLGAMGQAAEVPGALWGTAQAGVERLRASQAAREAEEAVAGQAAWGQAEAMKASALGRRTEALAAGETQKAGALAAYKDTTANEIEQQRGAMEKSFADQEAALYRSGLPPEEIAEQSQRLQAGKMAALGSMAAQTKIAFNQTTAQLTQAYDTLNTQIRQYSDQYAGMTEAQATGYQVDLTRLRADQNKAYLAEQAQYEQGYQSNLTTASQMKMSGLGAYADYLSGMNTYLAPLAPLIASAYAYQQAESKGLEMNVSGVGQLPQWSGGGEAGGYGLAKGTPGSTKSKKKAPTQGSTEWYQQQYGGGSEAGLQGPGRGTIRPGR